MPRPRFSTRSIPGTEDRCTGEPLLVSVAVLPNNCPVRLAVGLPQRTRSLAVASAALEACALLHQVHCMSLLHGAQCLLTGGPVAIRVRPVTQKAPTRLDSRPLMFDVLKACLGDWWLSRYGLMHHTTSHQGHLAFFTSYCLRSGRALTELRHGNKLFACLLSAGRRSEE